ncbi:MAG: heparinase II/III family protein [Rhodospirillales bacterium]|nr:heparinase II/III family protein [Rhodospirillales bacterium]MCB9996279.1 heparinase II/III family protein [Rhodospirillales bacterium]
MIELPKPAVPHDLLRSLRAKAGQFAFNNVVYNWSLGGSVPHGFITQLADLWPGDAERGRWLCSGAFAMDGETLALHNDCWEPSGVGPHWLRHMHGFDWLRDLKALGGDAPRLQARAMIESWIKRYNLCQPSVWRADYTGRRLAGWIALYDFFGESADEDFQDQFFVSLIRQARHLSRAAPGNAPGLPAFYAVKGLIYAGIALQGRESWLEQGLDLLEQETGKQILPDGGHISRSPAQLCEVLQIFIDVRQALIAGEYPVPERMAHTIDRMAQALRFFRYADRHFALFHGTQEGDLTLIDAVLNRSNARGKVLPGLPQSGFERMTLGRSMVMVDCGTPPPSPYDTDAHASPLAFEFVYGKERVFVCCGSHPLDPAWQDSLRATAAHNTLGIDYRNSCEIRDHQHGHFGRKPRKVTMLREESKDAVLVEATHDGYVPLNGITHRRRLYLGASGHDLRGEENLTCSIGTVKPAEVTLRFHLHPRVLVSLIQNGEEALLRLPGGAGWRFFHSAGKLSLENSIYLGQGTRPRKTKQLVITGRMDCDTAQIKWALQREAR